jgi:prepilin-type N-terminal cleavage/methylation domain-containing protein
MAQQIKNVRRAFTIIEMMVAVSLLVIIMAAVGQVFRSTGSAVSLSQAHSEVISNVRRSNAICRALTATDFW